MHARHRPTAGSTADSAEWQLHEGQHSSPLYNEEKPRSVSNVHALERMCPSSREILRDAKSLRRRTARTCAGPHKQQAAARCTSKTSAHPYPRRLVNQEVPDIGISALPDRHPLNASPTEIHIIKPKRSSPPNTYSARSCVYSASNTRRPQTTDIAWARQKETTGIGGFRNGLQTAFGK